MTHPWLQRQWFWRCTADGVRLRPPLSAVVLSFVVLSLPPRTLAPSTSHRADPLLVRREAGSSFGHPSLRTWRAKFERAAWSAGRSIFSAWALWRFAPSCRSSTLLPAPLDSDGPHARPGQSSWDSWADMIVSRLCSRSARAQVVGGRRVLQRGGLVGWLERLALSRWPALPSLRCQAKAICLQQP